jgi:hypothetical protein
LGANLNKKSILLVVEGQVAEPRILGSATHGILSLIGSDYNIHPFANSIYELYEAYRDHVYLSSQFENRLKQVMRRPILESNQHKLGG